MQIDFSDFLLVSFPINFTCCVPEEFESMVPNDDRRQNLEMKVQRFFVKKTWLKPTHSYLRMLFL
jgi:hypothetical protein